MPYFTDKEIEIYQCAVSYCTHLCNEQGLTPGVNHLSWCRVYKDENITIEVVNQVWGKYFLF